MIFITIQQYLDEKFSTEEQKILIILNCSSNNISNLK